MTEELRFEVDLESATEQEPGRLDQYLSKILSERNKTFSRSFIQKLIEDGQVLVNDKVCKASFKLRGGEIIDLSVPDASELEIKAENIPLEIIYEDDQLLVINKCAGLVVHPGAGRKDGTLVNALLNHCRDCLPGIGGVMRPGIVHRLDKDTSGLMMVAKTDRAQLSLSGQIGRREAKRVYIALLEGQIPLDQGSIDKPIGRHKKDRTKMTIDNLGRKAQTDFEVLRRWSKFCLIRASLKTGRTHQIRVHMESLNCPVVGDIVYNKKTSGTEAARKKLGLKGHALHATYLSFRHPTTGLLLEFETELPDDFKNLIDRL